MYKRQDVNFAIVKVKANALQASLEAELRSVRNRVAQLEESIGGQDQMLTVLQREIEVARAGQNRPTFLHGEDLKFEKVSVYRPDGTLLVADLDFEVRRGSRVLVTGGNGCGKSSLFRVIRKLWPLVSGTITVSYTHLTLPTIYSV